jgi:hypothetical protein
VLGLHCAFRKSNQHVLIISAGEDSSRRLLGEIRALVAASPLLRASAVDEFAGLLTLSNGSTIRSVPASERQVRGWSIDLLLVDEAALVSDDLLLGAGMPTTAARPNARIVLASSALSASGAFYDHATAGESGSEHIRTFRWALGDASWISASVIASARESMSAARFAAEYEGQFASGQDSLFSRQVLDRVICDRKLHLLENLEGPARCAGGVDWGSVNDRSVLTAIGRIPGTDTFSVVCSHRWLAGELPHVVTQQIADCPAYFQFLTLEMNGLGAPMSIETVRRMRERPARAGGGVMRRSVVIDAVDQLYPKKPKTGKYKTPVRRPSNFVTSKNLVHVNAASKAAMYSSLRLLVGKEQLLIPRDAETLIRELLMLRVDLGATGTEKIEASQGHDDCADSLALAMGPYKMPDGGPYRTMLARCAERPPIPPWTAVHEDDLSAYQSVAGGEVSAISTTIEPPIRESRGVYDVIRPKDKSHG